MRRAEGSQRHRSQDHRCPRGAGTIRIKPDEINHVIFGFVLQSSPDAVYLARHFGLGVEAPHSVPALTLSRLCGSGFRGAQMLLMGEADWVLAGGTENMSQAPHVFRGARWGIPLGKARMADSL